MDNDNEFIHVDEQSPDGPEPASSQTLSPIRGFYWLERSLSEIYVPHFKDWFIAALIFSAITTIIPAVIPLAAFPLAIINPLFVAGLLIGAHRIYRNDNSHNASPLQPLQMLEAFKHKQVANIVIYAVITIVLAIAILLILALIIGIDNLQSIDFALISAGNEDYAKELFKMISPAIVWALLLGILFSLATWFAVSLIIFSEQKALPAIGNSFVGGLKNFFAIVVLALVAIVCLIIIALIASLVLAMFGNLATNPVFNIIIETLFTALLLPIGIGVTYIAYREIFLGDIQKSDKSL